MGIGIRWGNLELVESWPRCNCASMCYQMYLIKFTGFIDLSLYKGKLPIQTKGNVYEEDKPHYCCALKWFSTQPSQSKHKTIGLLAQLSEVQLESRLIKILLTR